MLEAASQWWHQLKRACTATIPTLVEAEFAARKQAGKKAPGPDGIPNEPWRDFPVQAGGWFWALCLRISLVRKEPLQFKRALVCALHKKGPAALPENYRSIALLNGMAKIWHGRVHRIVGQSVLGRYDPLQLGGHAGVPVGCAVAAFRSALDLSTAQGPFSAVLFVDIQAAYYEASRSLLFHGDSAGVPPSEQHLMCLRCFSHPVAEPWLSTRAHSALHFCLARLDAPDTPVPRVSESRVQGFS